ncbi:MAG: ROK family protein [Acidobacteria bacterium]|nr:ROK family protein [Acidobacteriota bacterium]
MRALAIDLGGTHAKCAVVEDRKVQAARHLDLDSAQGLNTALPLFAGTLRELLSECGLSAKDCAGLSFGSCGIVDSSTGRFLSTNQKWDDAPSLDLPEWCRQEFSLPLRLENDARMALLGEWYAGAARGFEDVAMLTLGTGIGGAAMIGGRLLRGKHSQAGNLGGHQPVLFTGRACTCGGIGCAEAEAGGWSLPLIAREWPGFEQSALAKEAQVNFKALFRLAGQGDRVSGEVRDRCLHVWAAAAVGMVHAFDPEVVVFGGGVMKSADVILPFVQEYVGKHTWTPWGKVQVRAAELGNDAGLLGAIPLLSE